MTEKNAAKRSTGRHCGGLEAVRSPVPGMAVRQYNRKMKTFEQFVYDDASHSGVNVIFEAGMYSLTNDVEQIVKALRDAGVDFAVIGGVAVNAHIYALNRSRSFVTRHIDVLVHRRDLDTIAKAAKPLGYEAKKMMGGYTLHSAWTKT